MSAWQPINTIPKERTVLVGGGDGIWAAPSLGFAHTNYNGHKDVITEGGRAGPAMTGGMRPRWWMEIPPLPTKEAQP